jgi:hypothetical protein
MSSIKSTPKSNFASHKPIRSSPKLLNTDSRNRSSSILRTEPHARPVSNTGARLPPLPQAHVMIVACRVPLDPQEVPDDLDNLESLEFLECPECRVVHPKELAKFRLPLHASLAHQGPQAHLDCPYLKVTLAVAETPALGRSQANPDPLVHLDPLDPLGRLEKMEKLESLEFLRLPQSHCPVTPVNPETLDPQDHPEPLENPVAMLHPVHLVPLDPPDRMEVPVLLAKLDPLVQLDPPGTQERKEFALVIVLWTAAFSSRMGN